MRAEGVRFEVGEYDRSRPLVIDPAPSGYSTYLGGSNLDSAYGIALGPTGSVYVTGVAQSSDFPTVSPYQAAVSATDILKTDVFITRINAAGTAIEYSTYLGGNSRDFSAAPSRLTPPATSTSRAPRPPRTSRSEARSRGTAVAPTSKAATSSCRS